MVNQLNRHQKKKYRKFQNWKNLFPCLGINNQLILWHQMNLGNHNKQNNQTNKSVSFPGEKQRNSTLCPEISRDFLVTWFTMSILISSQGSETNVKSTSISFARCRSWFGGVIMKSMEERFLVYVSAVQFKVGWKCAQLLVIMSIVNRWKWFGNLAKFFVVCICLLFRELTPHKTWTKGGYVCSYNKPIEALRFCNSCIVNEKRCARWGSFQHNSQPVCLLLWCLQETMRMFTVLPNHFSLLPV